MRFLYEVQKSSDYFYLYDYDYIRNLKFSSFFRISFQVHALDKNYLIRIMTTLKKVAQVQSQNIQLVITNDYKNMRVLLKRVHG